MSEQSQQRTSEQSGEQDGVQGYLLSIVPIAELGVLPGGQPPSAGKPLLAGYLVREGLIVPDGPGGGYPLPNPFQGQPHVNW